MDVWKNPFFRLAMHRAGRLLGKPGRLVSLAAQLFLRLYRADKAQLSTQLKEKASVLGRMVQAYAHGGYRNIPVKSLLLVVASVLYFLNPFDLIPDLLLGIGLTDDLAVLTWVYHSVSQEINTFLQWENNSQQTPKD